MIAWTIIFSALSLGSFVNVGMDASEVSACRIVWTAFLIGSGLLSII